jgi:hypothetical protein
VCHRVREVRVEKGRPRTLWCLVVLFAVNTVGNLRGRHPFERWGQGTVAALLAVLCALIAVG